MILCDALGVREWCADVGFEFITIIIRLFPTKQDVSSARDLSSAYSFSRMQSFFVIVREGKFFSARVCTLYTGREKIQMEANTMTCPPVQRGSSKWTVRDDDGQGATLRGFGFVSG